MADYKSQKEAFVSHITGSSVTHVNLVSSIALVSIALHSSIRSKFGLTPNFGTEWLLLVLPLLLSMTLFAGQPLVLVAFILIPTIIIYIFPWKRRRLSRSPQPEEVPRPPSPSHAIDIPSQAGVASAPSEPSPSSLPSRARITVSPIPWITTYRSHMMLMTILAILAVDFPAFPRYLAKCETFGVSLMDLGVGSFVFSQGVVSAIPILKDPTYLIASPVPKILTAIRKILPILIIGVVRVVMVKGTEYPEHESEYGTHWNFFFTLALLPVLQILLHPVLLWTPISLTGFLIALSHQMALSLTSLQNYTLNARRSNLISANKEGLVSLTGYLAIHILGLSAGTVVLPPSPSDFRRLQQRLRLEVKGVQDSQSGSSPVRPYAVKVLQRQDDKTATELFSYAFVWWSCLGICLFLNVGGGVSRRLTNIPYILWVAAYNTSFILCYLLLDLFFFPSPTPKAKVSGDYSNIHLVAPSHSAAESFRPFKDGSKKAPALLEAINTNGLVVFLLANIATGLVNLSVKTMYSPDWAAILVLSTYSMFICGFAWITRGKKIWNL